MTNWDNIKWLEALAYLVPVLGGIFSAYLFLYRLRKRHIAFIFCTIARAWTNEGDIRGTNTLFVTLELEDWDSDLVGSLSSNAHDRVLEAHAYVGWFSIRLEVAELRGRSLLPIGTVNLKLTDNNRLRWRYKKQSNAKILPSKTMLWPSTLGVSR